MAGLYERIGHGAAVAVRTDFHPRRDPQEPRRGGADAPVFGGQGLRHRLAPDECRPLCRRRGRAGDHGIDQGRAPRLRHGGRSRHLGRRLRARPQALRRLHPPAQFGARHPARPFRPQGAALPAVGGRRAADTVARGRRLGAMGACVVERHQCTGDGPDTACAHTRRDPRSDRALGPGGAARQRGGLRRARYPCRARLPDPPVPLAVLQRAQRRVRRQRTEPHALLHRGRGKRARPLAGPQAAVRALLGRGRFRAGDRTRAWRWPGS